MEKRPSSDRFEWIRWARLVQDTKSFNRIFPDITGNRTTQSQRCVTSKILKNNNIQQAIHHFFYLESIKLNVDYPWSSWSQWSSCSQNGLMKRSRNCLEDPCQGMKEENRPCGNSKLTFYRMNCLLVVWKNSCFHCRLQVWRVGFNLGKLLPFYNERLYVWKSKQGVFKI